MEIKKIKIALDLDGVIWNLVSPWLYWYNVRYSDNVTYNSIVEYDLCKKCTRASQSQLMDILKKDYFWDSVYPFAHARKYLEKLNDIFDLYIATATSHETARPKIDRFLNLFPFINHEQIICIYNKSLLNVDWLVDDFEFNLSKGNFNKIILDAPYNRNCKEDYIRANNLKDVYDILVEYYKE